LGESDDEVLFDADDVAPVCGLEVPKEATVEGDAPLEDAN
jgi:hypothetical protein